MADCVHAIARAEADKAWLDRAAEADKRLVAGGDGEIGQATAQKSLTVALAAIDKTYATDLADETQRHENQVAGIQATYWSAYTTASNQWRSGMAAADTGFWSAQYADQATAVTAIYAALGTPWAQYVGDWAVAEAAWWEGIKPRETKR